MIPDEAAQQEAALALGFNLTHSLGSLDPKWENRRSVRPSRPVHQNGRTAAATVPASTGLRMLDFVRCMAAINHNRVLSHGRWNLTISPVLPPDTSIPLKLAF
jgi:hypothetical protein